jgi:hypothetical protein
MARSRDRLKSQRHVLNLPVIYDYSMSYHTNGDMGPQLLTTRERESCEVQDDWPRSLSRHACCCSRMYCTVCAILTMHANVQ